MNTLTATEASRSFAALLDDAERGETIVITRAGRRVAVVGPAPLGNGADFLALLSGEPEAVDDAFADDVHAARDAVTSEVPAWAAD